MITLILLFFSTVDFRVEQILIKGNEHFKDSAIKNVMLTKTLSIFNRGKFLPEIFEGDITAIENLYDYNGFLEARVDYDLNIDSVEKTVEIQIIIIEGKQTFVEDINFTGNTLFKNDFLNEKTTTRPDEYFDKRKVELDNYIIISLYDDKGHTDANVQSEYMVKDYKAIIVHNIIEGEKQYIKKIEFVGIKRTREDIVVREINLKPNDTFRYANILKSQRNLYNLGVFRSIRIQTMNASEPNFKIVQFMLLEKKPIIINFRIGYGTQDYLRLGIGLTHLNLLGRAWQGQIETKASFAEYRFDSKLTFPRFIIFPIKVNIGAFYQMKKEIGFRTRSVGGYTNAFFNLAGGILSARYKIENIRTDYADYDSVDNDWLQGITINWMRDRRDDPFSTRTGTYLNANLETSGIIVPADINYVRPVLEYRLFKPISVFTAASSFKVGMVRVVSPSTEVPVYKRFYCGGTTSIRGYSEWSIGPKDDTGNPLGGIVLFEASGEIRFPIYKIFGGVFFIDAGNTWRSYDEINSHLRWGVGAGLRLMTPVGNVRLDYGIKLGRQPEESAAVLHFAIGEAF